MSEDERISIKILESEIEDVYKQMEIEIDKTSEAAENLDYLDDVIDLYDNINAWIGPSLLKRKWNTFLSKAESTFLKPAEHVETLKNYSGPLGDFGVLQAPKIGPCSGKNPCKKCIERNE